MTAKATAGKLSAHQAAPQTNARKQAGAQAAGLLRTGALYKRWRITMAAIEQEVFSNGGIYPKNNGHLNLTEVARRAGTVVNSLYPPRHADFKIEVDDFIGRLNRLAPTKNLLDKPSGPTWEELYKATVSNYQVSALVWRSDRSRCEALEQRVEELEATVARHLETIGTFTKQVAELTRGRVVAIGSKKVGS